MAIEILFGLWSLAFSPPLRKFAGQQIGPFFQAVF